MRFRAGKTAFWRGHRHLSTLALGQARQSSTGGAARGGSCLALASSTSGSGASEAEGGDRPDEDRRRLRPPRGSCDLPKRAGRRGASRGGASFRRGSPGRELHGPRRRGLWPPARMELRWGNGEAEATGRLAGAWGMQWWWRNGEGSSGSPESGETRGGGYGDGGGQRATPGRGEWLGEA